MLRVRANGYARIVGDIRGRADTEANPKANRLGYIPFVTHSALSGYAE